MVGEGCGFLCITIVTTEIDFRLSEAVTIASILDVAKVCLLTPVPELGKIKIR